MQYEVFANPLETNTMLNSSINGVSLEAVMAYIKGYQHQEREKDQVSFDCMLENVQSYEKYYGY